MLNFNNLPFERGDTFGGASGMTLANVNLDHLVGATFVVPDTEHSTGAEVVLRLVKNDSGAAITFSNQIVRFGTDAKDFGRKVDGTTNVLGMIGLPIDDAFTSSYSIPANDYFYVIERGPCTIATDGSACNLVAHEPVTPNASGALGPIAAGTGEFILGTVDEDEGTAASTTLVWVDATLSNPYGSGT